MITFYLFISVTVAIISEILPLLSNSQFSGILHSILVLLQQIRQATPHNPPSTSSEEYIEQFAENIINNRK